MAAVTMYIIQLIERRKDDYVYNWNVLWYLTACKIKMDAHVGNIYESLWMQNIMGDYVKCLKCVVFTPWNW